MATRFIVHPHYKSIETDLRASIESFDALGDFVVKGERNVIKKEVIGNTTFNIKKFRTPRFPQSLVYEYIRKGKAQRSFEYATLILQKGILTPHPVAYLENRSNGLKDSYYISEHITYDFDFRVLNHNPIWPHRTEILKQMAAFTFQLHENGINFLDHSPGNTLIKKRGEGQYDFYLIDLNRMRFEAMDFHGRMRNFRRLWLSKTMIRVMAKEYALLYGKPESEVHALMTKYSRQFQKKVNSKKLRKRKYRK